MHKDLYITNLTSNLLGNNVDSQATDNIYSRLRCNQTYKTTKVNRFSDIDIKTKELLKNYFFKKIDVCDFGLSSGQTTLELANTLDTQVGNLFGFDKQIRVTLYQYGKFVFLYDLDKKIMLSEYNGFSIKRRYSIILKLMEKMLYKFLYKSKKVKAHGTTLLSKNLQALDYFHWDEQDIFNIDRKYYNKFDFVRVANLLNKVYFNDDQLKIGIENIKYILKDGGILLINKTELDNENDGQNNGTFFIKQDDRLMFIEDFNFGSEVKKIVLRK